MLNTAKAELHIHLEGSLEPEMMFNLAQRNKVNLKYQTVDEVKQAYKFNNLQRFLDVYYQGISVLKTQEDFYDPTFAYLTKAHIDHVTHVELFVDIQAHLMNNDKLDNVFNGINAAIIQAKSQFGIQTSIIICFLRHLSEYDALVTFEKIMPYRKYFIGIGLDSSEISHPPIKFTNLFNLARQEKLKLVAHACEEGPCEYVWQAIDVLGVDRIDHGNAIITDKELIKRIALDKIPLTMCPLSNMVLSVVPNLADHQAKYFLDQGIMVTINSDDPAYFGGYINQNYLALIDALNLSPFEVQQLITNSMQARFIK